MEERKIINTYDQNVAAGGDRVVIYRQTQDVGRGSRCASWQVGHFVEGKPKVTDPDAHWQDRGHKTFLILGIADRKPKFEEAVAWATLKYGPREFVRNRHGNFVEKEVNDKFPLPKRERRSKVETV